jgi:hypothetical protein
LKGTVAESYLAAPKTLNDQCQQEEQIAKKRASYDEQRHLDHDTDNRYEDTNS